MSTSDTNMEKRLNIRIDKELLEKYKKHCDKHGLSISKRVRNFIECELKKDGHGK